MVLSPCVRPLEQSYQPRLGSLDHAHRHLTLVSTPVGHRRGCSCHLAGIWRVPTKFWEGACAPSQCSVGRDPELLCWMLLLKMLFPTTPLSLPSSWTGFACSCHLASAHRTTQKLLGVQPSRRLSLALIRLGFRLFQMAVLAALSLV